MWVVPGARSTEIVGYHGDALRVRVAAPPENGKANRAVVSLLSDSLHAKVQLASGAGSRRKSFVVVGVSALELVSRLASIVD